MDIAGIGTHVVECVRVAKLLGRHADAFLDLVYTPREQAFCRERTHTAEHYAAVWAAKQAVFRSLGTAWRRGTPWAEVEVICDAGATPGVVLTGGAAGRAEALGVRSVLVTLAHCRAFATATAIALRG